MPQGVVKPSNQIVAYGDPLAVEMEIGANATTAKMLPGRVVVFHAHGEKYQGKSTGVWFKARFK